MHFAVSAMVVISGYCYILCLVTASDFVWKEICGLFSNSWSCVFEQATDMCSEDQLRDVTSSVHSTDVNRIYNVNIVLLMQIKAIVPLVCFMDHH